MQGRGGGEEEEGGGGEGIMLWWRWGGGAGAGMRAEVVVQLGQGVGRRPRHGDRLCLLRSGL
jgi:hypothetical protein